MTSRAAVANGIEQRFRRGLPVRCFWLIWALLFDHSWGTQGTRPDRLFHLRMPSTCRLLALRGMPLLALLTAPACAKPSTTIHIASPSPSSDPPVTVSIGSPTDQAATVHIASSSPAPPAPSGTLQIAAPPPPEPARPIEVPRVSDGAGPRITFGRAFTERLVPGFYGRFETEYFELRDVVITGALLGLEGWGTEGATAGGFAVPVSIFAGGRGGPFSGPKSPVLVATAGIGVDVLVYDRIGQSDGFGLLSPFFIATAGIEVVPGIRLLADGRAIYRWHWTSRSNAQYQLGVTLSLNSYLWDGP